MHSCTSLSASELCAIFSKCWSFYQWPSPPHRPTPTHPILLLYSPSPLTVGCTCKHQHSCTLLSAVKPMTNLHMYTAWLLLGRLEEATYFWGWCLCLQCRVKGWLLLPEPTLTPAHGQVKNMYSNVVISAPLNRDHNNYHSSACNDPLPLVHAEGHIYFIHIMHNIWYYAITTNDVKSILNACALLGFN